MAATSRRLLISSVLAGIGLGVFSILADGIIPWQPITILGNLATPWALVAFFLGRLAPSRKQGAVAGAAALLLGVATYYLRATLAGYFAATGNLFWAAAAIVLGPVLGAAGAASKERPPPTWPVAAPSALLLAESLFFLSDRRIWLWDFGARPALFLDLSVVLLMIGAAVALPFALERDRHRRRKVFLTAASAGAVGAVAYVLFYSLLVGLSG